MLTPVPDTSKELTEGQLSLSLKSTFETWTLHTSRPTIQGWVAFTSVCSSPIPISSPEHWMADARAHGNELLCARAYHGAQG